MTRHGIAQGDKHSGHKVGLTPYPWQLTPRRGGFTKRSKWAKIQTELWQAYISILSGLPKLDFILELGDMIDGKAHRSGGTELITSDIQEQCDMAVEIYEETRKFCKKNVKVAAVYGTDYHVATEGEDWENEIAYRAGFTKIGAHEWPQVNGCVFDIKHKVGSSTIPHGRFTAIAKEKMWNALWAEREEQPRSDVLIRAHAHYYSAIDTADGCAMILPALQGMGSRYGSRQCSGTVDWGLVHFVVHDDGSVDWYPHIIRINAQKAQVTKI